MDKMKKQTFVKITALLLTLICLVCGFTGCTTTPTDTTDTTASIESDSITTAEVISADTTTVKETAKAPETTKSPETTKAPETTATPDNTRIPVLQKPSVSLADIPAYTASAYTVINNNKPYYKQSDYTTRSFEQYNDLDSLGRCTLVYASIGRDLMPTEERGSIGSVKPSGWQTVKYDCVNGKYLYNRAHLIGWQLTGENANTKNLITGTRYLNIEGMLPFENMIADYVKETGNHVLYRVTPMFEGNDLVARGVLMEGYSVEDNGEGIEFCVFAYNVQPNIRINYADGSSELEAGGQITDAVTDAVTEAKTEAETQATKPGTQYTLNTSSKKFHYPSCYSAKKISEKNKGSYTGSRDELIADGYSPCGNCDP